MTMFEDFIVKTKLAMGAAGEKANQMYIVTKLSIKLAELKSEMKKLLIKLGKVTYHCSKKGCDHEKKEEKVEKIVAKIDKLRQKIKKLKSKIESAKHKIVCKSCCKGDSDDDLFCCEKCGNDCDCDECECDDKNCSCDEKQGSEECDCESCDSDDDAFEKSQSHDDEPDDEDVVKF